MDPFETMNELLPTWTLAFATLSGVMGFTDPATRTIWINLGLTRRQRRSTIIHEIFHALRGDRDDDPAAEEQVAAAAANLLIPFDRLADAVARSRHADDVCDILEVDIGVLRTRVRHLADHEAAELRRQLLAAAPFRQTGTGPATCVLTEWWHHLADYPGEGREDPVCGHTSCRTGVGSNATVRVPYLRLVNSEMIS